MQDRGSDVLVSLSFASGFTVPVAPNHAVGSVGNFLQKAMNPTSDTTCPPAGQLYLRRGGGVVKQVSTCCLRLSDAAPSLEECVPSTLCPKPKEFSYACEARWLIFAQLGC